MKDFLHEYSGICNFNYKVRPNGRMCIFEARRHATLAMPAPGAAPSAAPSAVQ